MLITNTVVFAAESLFFVYYDGYPLFGWARGNLVKAGLDVHWLTQNEQRWMLLVNGCADAIVTNE